MRTEVDRLVPGQRIKHHAARRQGFGALSLRMSMLAGALRYNLTSGAACRRRFARAVARYPIEFAAGEVLAAVPTIALAEVADLTRVPPLAATDVWGGRGTWSIGVAERCALHGLASGRGVTNAFEIGTFNGGTTAMLAAALPEHGRVVTLDLPPASFDASQHPADLAGDRVGEIWRASPHAGKVEQLLHDSLTFDSAPYAGGFDLVLVDGAHDYVHGVADTRTALRLARPGGIVVFDDFAAYWHGLVRGIVEAAAGLPLRRIERTSLACIEVPAPSASAL